MNPFTLHGKNIIVTGAASGIGRETARILSSMGGELLLLDVDKDGLLKTKSMSEGKVVIRSVDLTNEEVVKRLIAEEKNEFPGKRFDGLVHCAGIPSIVPLRVLTSDEYDRVQAINTKAGLSLAKIFSRRGIYNEEQICSIVLISSVYGVVGSASNVAYAVSKAANIGMTKALAIELAKKKIRVNCIAPGFIKTPMEDKTRPMFDESYEEDIGKMHPLGWGTPSDIANGVAYLLSDAARWVTGAVLNIDGGFTAQ